MKLKDYIQIKLKATDDFISGQELAHEFGVSRTAVWKAIGQLKDEGCVIDSMTNRGYRLRANSDMLSAEVIEAGFRGNAKALTVIIFESVDSTNNEAKRMVAYGFSGNALIIANEQTGGRGRLGRNFYSPKNTGIYMTLILQSDLPLSDAVTVTTAASVAVVKAIKSTADIEPQIKWVNDVYLNGKKICGILTEAVSDFETATARSVIIGIGINISTEDFPEEIAMRASSLGARRPPRNALISEIANELMDIWKDLPDKSSFLDYYKKHSLVIGKEIDFYENAEKKSGKAVDIDDNGGLIVELPSGGSVTLSSGEVTIRLAEQK